MASKNIASIFSEGIGANFSTESESAQAHNSDAIKGIQTAISK